MQFYHHHHHHHHHTTFIDLTRVCSVQVHGRAYAIEYRYTFKTRVATDTTKYGLAAEYYAFCFAAGNDNGGSGTIRSTTTMSRRRRRGGTRTTNTLYTRKTHINPTRMCYV